VRARLTDELAQVGPRVLHERLATLVPHAAAAILPSNGRRIVRALEVVELTGDFRPQLPDYGRGVYDTVQLGVDTPELDERIAGRVMQMWAAGFVDEVGRLEREGLREGPTASRALGYAQVLAWMSGVLDSSETALQATIDATRRFSRRQRSWFRRDPRVVWVGAPDVDRAVAEVSRSACAFSAQ
jgi:tRNA dimethylallyltransferase